VVQLYASPSWDIAQALVKRAEKGGAPVVVVTVDRVGGRNQEPFLRMSKKDTRNCEGCHPKDLQGSVARKPAYAGIDVSGARNLQSANMTWDFVKRLRDTTKMKVVLKGILTAEDAEFAVKPASTASWSPTTAGAARTRAARPSTCCRGRGRGEGQDPGAGRRRLPPRHRRVQGARPGRGRLRRRPSLPVGLGAFGEPGVAKVLELLRTEFRAAMMQCGVQTVKASRRIS